jgi:DNA polymerase
MTWSEAQLAMLRGMGLRVWTPPAPDQVTGQEVTTPEPAATSQPVALATVMAEAVPVRRAASAAPVPVASVFQAEVRSQPGAHDADAADAADAEQRARHISTLDWPALRQAAAACKACGLCAERRQTVFGVGDPRAHWMVVGEAPGEQEDLKGEPFVGPSGELLDAMLRALSLSRAEDGPAPPAQRVYIANTVKCRPPRNRNPAPDEMARCEPFLVRQIQLVQPRIILAMGRFAVQALLRTNEPIGRLRGRVHQYQGVPLIVTYHPDYLRNNLADKARAWDDLCLAADTADK